MGNDLGNVVVVVAVVVVVVVVIAWVVLNYMFFTIYSY